MFAKRWGVNLHFQWAYVPSGKGIVERSHRSIKQIAVREAKCTPQEMVYWYNVMPKDGVHNVTAPVNVLYLYMKSRWKMSMRFLNYHLTASMKSMGKKMCWRRFNWSGVQVSGGWGQWWIPKQLCESSASPSERPLLFSSFSEQFYREWDHYIKWWWEMLASDRWRRPINQSIMTLIIWVV